MTDLADLARTLTRLDGRGYKGYKEIQGRSYQSGPLTLIIDHVQGDPYAAPSRLRAIISRERVVLPPSAEASPARCRATRDHLARLFARHARNNRAITIDVGGQTVLDRSCCLLHDDTVELRFTVDLPAGGRTIHGRAAKSLLCDHLPAIIEEAIDCEQLDLEALEHHNAVVEDQVALRGALSEHGLIAFVANGACLPRRTGIDDRPLDDPVRFAAPKELEVTLPAPNAGQITGLGIPTGITLVVGGGYHGKSTLLRALERGVYDHIPGDGREGVVADPTAVKIRAEDGRSVAGVNISPFIDNLPLGQPTADFSTDLASGSTSQAASLMEALECGARALLVDEDTSASNFMVRDARMQRLVRKDREPITPFVDRIAALHDRLGVSVVLVMGGSGDYFDSADTVIQMDGYHPKNVTAQALEVAAELPSQRQSESHGTLERPCERLLVANSLKPERRPGRIKIAARDLDTLIFGNSDVDLRALEQLESPSQIRAIGWIMEHLSREEHGHPLPVIRSLLLGLEAGEWDNLTGRPDGDLALPRAHEVMATLNRLRGVGMRTG